MELLIKCYDVCFPPLSPDAYLSFCVELLLISPLISDTWQGWQRDGVGRFTGATELRAEASRSKKKRKEKNPHQRDGVMDGWTDGGKDL